jgi:dUTP pyrophosphatase
MQVRVINHSEHPLPEYQSALAAGLDLKAWMPTSVVMQPLQRVLIPTGLHIELPAGYEAQVRPRSGLALKFGITVLNSPGTIDADYRGEIKVLLINLGSEPFVVQNGERIAQLVVARHERIDWIESGTLTESDRASGGFGSTGKQ